MKHMAGPGRLAILTQLVLAQLFLNAVTLKTDSSHAARSTSTSSQSYLGRRGVLEEDAAGNRVRLAKHVAAEKSPPFQTKVPRIIVQSWKSDGLKDPNSLWVPKARADVMLTWLEQNPTYAYRLFDDEDIEAYVAKNFDQSHLETLRSINQGASKVDFWRILYVLHDGGVYFDTDSLSVTPLDEWVDSQATYVTGIGSLHDFHQWGIIAAPGNCILKQTADLIMANVQEVKTKGKVETGYRGLSVTKVDSSGVHAGFDSHFGHRSRVESFAGPPVLMKAADKCLMDPASSATTLPGLILCSGDFFGHRTRFKSAQLFWPTWSDAEPLLNFIENNATKQEPCGQLILDN